MRISDWSSDVCSSDLKCRRWSVAGIGTGRIFIIVPPLHQRRRLRETIDKQGTVMRRIKGIARFNRCDELHWNNMRALVQKLEHSVLRIGADPAPGYRSSGAIQDRKSTRLNSRH